MKPMLAIKIQRRWPVIAARLPPMRPWPAGLRRSSWASAELKTDWSGGMHVDALWKMRSPPS